MPENTKPKDLTPRSRSKFIKFLLGALTIVVYFFGLNIPLVGPDEPRYAQVAREMFERGDWITPTLGGVNWFEKPALLYWLEIASYQLFGVNEFAARFGPALFGLGTIASLWILGRFLVTQNTEKDEIDKKSTVAKNFPFYLSLIAASTLGIIVFSRGASFDIIITFPLTAALVSFFIWHAKNEMSVSTRPRVSAPLLSFYFFIGVALLAKGLIGMIFPFAIVSFYYLLSWRLPSKLFTLSVLWGTIIVLAVASIWYVPVYLQNGYSFIDEFFIQHHFQRFTSNKFQHPQPFYFFLWILPLMTLPWLPLFIAAMVSFVRRIFYQKNPGTSYEARGLPFSSSPLLRFSIAWLVVPLVFFSMSGSKLPGYILPSVPAAIIFTAIYISGLVEKRKAWDVAVKAIALTVFLATIVTLVTFVPRFAATDSVKALIQAANDRGYSNEKVLSLHTISHNAEFYAAGRLLRDEAGKQKRLYGPGEVLAEITAENGMRVLVLVPLEYLVQLTSNDKLAAEIIGDNGELAIVAVSLK